MGLWKVAVDCLHDLGVLLGNADGRLWKMQNGYPLMLTREGLHTIDAQLAALDDAGRDALKAALRIGLHWGVEVTDIRPVGHRVSQAFCSALPIAYQGALLRDGPWQRFASLVLEASYEATLLAGVLNLARVGCAKVFLTGVGAGAFGVMSVQNTLINEELPHFRWPRTS